MTTLHSLLVGTHIAVGSFALLLFWVPAVARKGSRLHVRAGRLYAIAMYVVSITAFIASIMVLADPLGIRRPGELPDPERAASLAQGFRMFSLFLLMLSVLVFTSVRHGVAALRERTAPGSLSRPVHRALIAALGLLAVVVGALGIVHGQLLLIIFGGISLASAWGMSRDLGKTERRPSDLVVAHLNGLIGSGIGAYTAFFAFGGSRFFGELLPGQWQVVPWVLPAIVGTVVISRLSRRFGRRPRRDAPLAAAADAESS